MAIRLGWLCGIGLGLSCLMVSENCRWRVPQPRDEPEPLLRQKRPPSPSNPIELGERLDINAAGREDLESLPGIGPVLAGRIVEFPNQEPPFPASRGNSDHPGNRPAQVPGPAQSDPSGSLHRPALLCLGRRLEMTTVIPTHSPLPRGFHPYLAQWFRQRFAAPSPAQKRGWRPVMSGRDTLIAAPTGSGKTLAAFLWSLNRLVRLALKGRLEDRTYVVYVSPLKALGNDIHKNLQVPMEEIGRIAQEAGEASLGIRVAVRSGDTPNSERQAMLRRPPHILITTPESLYILLTAKGSRGYLAGAETVIVDEIHAVSGDKRGSHLALSLERLDHLAGRRLQRIGLSATQKPVSAIARLLVGTSGLRPKGRVNCSIVDIGHQRDLELSIAIPDLEFGPIASLELWESVYERIAAESRAHRSTLVFVHTRRLAERVAHKLSQRLGEDQVATHHGSLSKESRLAAEQQLKSGVISVVVATASLELGIDIGHVDLVCHVGAPRSIASLLQRIGRSGHGLDTTPKGLLFPLTRDELLQTAAARAGRPRRRAGSGPHPREATGHPGSADGRHRRQRRDRRGRTLGTVPEGLSLSRPDSRRV